MTVNFIQNQIDRLVSEPSEALQVEIKTWLDPQSEEGIAKIVKNCIALRNFNGGFLVLGIDDTTLLPDPYNLAIPVREAYHLDVIQPIVTRYSSEAFEITVAYATRGEQEHPVIIIPGGVRTPVAVTRDLLLENDHTRKLLRENAVYFRTLNTGGRPSTSEAHHRDWNDIVEICFENREADIGRFIRRHLSTPEGIEALQEFSNTQNINLREITYNFLNESHHRREIQLAEATLSNDERQIINLGLWETALVVHPDRPNSIATQEFLNIIDTSNPRYTGWPAWLISQGFHNTRSRPQVYENIWEELIVSTDSSFSHADFLRFNPNGYFYQSRILEDDLLNERYGPGNVFDPFLCLIRVAETIATGLEIIRSLNFSDESNIGFMFRWTGLSNRELRSWSNPRIYFHGGDLCQTNTIETYVSMPTDTPVSAIPPYVKTSTDMLFAAFNGRTFGLNIIEHHTERLVTRNL